MDPGINRVKVRGVPGFLVRTGKEYGFVSIRCFSKTVQYVYDLLFPVFPG